MTCEWRSAGLASLATSCIDFARLVFPVFNFLALKLFSEYKDSTGPHLVKHRTWNEADIGTTYSTWSISETELASMNDKPCQDLPNSWLSQRPCKRSVTNWMSRLVTPSANGNRVFLWINFFCNYVNKMINKCKLWKISPKLKTISRNPYL